MKVLFHSVYNDCKVEQPQTEEDEIIFFRISFMFVLDAQSADHFGTKLETFRILYSTLNTINTCHEGVKN